MATPKNSERIVKHSIKPDHGSADAAMLLCIDWRFWSATPENAKSTIQAFIDGKQWNKVVPLTEAGGVKLLVSDDPADEARKNVLFARIEEEIGLHHPKVLAVTAHRDCGKYGYFKAFDNDPEKENARLYGDLAKAKDELMKRFGALVAIETYVIDMEGVEQVTF